MGEYFQDRGVEALRQHVTKWPPEGLQNKLERRCRLEHRLYEMQL
jgi:hypothetical protein